MSKLGGDGDSVSDLTLYRNLAVQYLMFTRPDISYVVQQLFFASTTDLVAFQMQIGLHQPTLSHSSAEAEYRGVANVVAKTCWLRNLLRKLHTPLSSAMLVYCDNVGAVYLSCNLVQHQRTKHIEIDIHFVQDLVAASQVCVLHMPSRYHYPKTLQSLVMSTVSFSYRRCNVSEFGDSSTIMAGDEVNNNRAEQLENSLKEFRETVQNSLQQITQTLATLTTHENDERRNPGGPLLSRGHRNDHPQRQRVQPHGEDSDVEDEFKDGWNGGRRFGQRGAREFNYR
ncbi:ribonuclease H-like domain-containing protein [Tanacetum coccineum]